MKWYEDKEYWEMCERAEEIQLQKYKDGWQEGDRIWDGNKVRVIGFDFLNLKHRAESHYFKFAILQDVANIVFEQEAPHQNIKAKTGEYGVIEYANPVWLPSQEDLQEMVIKITTNDSLNQAALLCGWIVKNTKLHLYANKFNDSMTKLWFVFVMHKLYQKKWNSAIKKWENLKESKGGEIK